MSAPAPLLLPPPELKGVDEVVTDPLRFTAKLAIGEAAYASLRMINRGREVWDVLGAAGAGAAVAKTGMVASLLGASATPIGWVAFAALASGGACYGMYRLLSSTKGDRVIEIPKYLNTPLDTLGLALFDLIAPLSLRLAAVDGAIEAAERQYLVDHLIDDWGLNRAFVEQSVAWAARVIAGAAAPERANAVDPSAPDVAERWAGAVAAGRAFVGAKTSNASPAPAKVLDVLEANRTMTQAESAELECQTLADLMQTDEFRSTVYAFLDLVQRRSKRPAGAPDRKLARPVTKIGVVGAGLMASQLALLFARQLKVPVVMTDIDQARVDKGVDYVHAEVDKLLAKKRISPDAANRTKALVSGSISPSSGSRPTRRSPGSRNFT